MTSSETDWLLNGDQYKASLRDGRTVYDSSGELIEDVTAHPMLGPGIETLAQYYDMQHDPALRDVMTFVDEETGRRISRAWQVPRTKEDLAARRELARLSTYHSYGVFGRPPDYGSFNALGLQSVGDVLAKTNPEWASNVESYIRWGQQHNAMSSDVIGDVQSDRRIPLGEKPGRLRVVQERSDGLVLYGAKACNSVAAQGHVGTVMSLMIPGIDPNAAIYCAVPINAEGVTAVLREPTSTAGASEDHPLDSRGEEADCFLFYDHVVVPKDRVFSWRNTDLGPLYQEVGGLALWHILARLSYRAEIFAGTAQLIAETLGTTSVPQVRDSISEIVCYATTLKSHVLAAEDTAIRYNDVLVPNPEFITPGRLHSVVHYPRIVQLLRELSGQGLISRFSHAQYEVPALRQMIDEFLPGTGVSASAKNHLFNFVWDLTSSSHAMRVALFENVNATPASTMRNHIYQSASRDAWTENVREFIGIEFDTSESA